MPVEREPQYPSPERRAELEHRLGRLSFESERVGDCRFVEVDGRMVEAWRFGNPNYPTVFLLHGSPGHAHNPIPRNLTLYLLGVNVISYSRPGYGASDRHEGRRVADEVARIEAIANEYSIDTFSIIGRSGGGPSALAAAMLLRKRVLSTFIMAGPAPHSMRTDETPWEEGISPESKALHRYANENQSKLMEELRQLGDAVRQNPRHLLNFLEPQLASPDQAILDTSPLVSLLLRSYKNGLMQEDGNGWFDDIMALHAPEGWGFDLKETAAPLLLWYPEEDPFTPVEHGEWLRNKIPNAQLVVAPNKSHFNSFEIIREAIGWCRSQAQQEER